MKKMPLFLAVAMAASALVSCKKEQDQAPSAPQSSAASMLIKPDLLTTGNWHQTGLTVSTAAEGTNAAAGTSDLFAHAKPAMLIATATYQPGGTYSIMRGVRTGGPLPSPTTGKWRLNAAADSLIVTQADLTHHLAITELTATSLRLTHTEGGPGNLSTYTSVFSH